MEKIKEWIYTQNRPILDVEIRENFEFNEKIMNALKEDQGLMWKDYKLDDEKVVILFWRKDYRDKNAKFYCIFCFLISSVFIFIYLCKNTKEYGFLSR
jgi:hypothetical protein